MKINDLKARAIVLSQIVLIRLFITLISYPLASLLWYATCRKKRKRYISGFSFILKMSYFKRGGWVDIRDSIYRRLILSHCGFFSEDPGKGMTVSRLLTKNILYLLLNMQPQLVAEDTWKYGIPKGKEFSSNEVQYIVGIIGKRLENQTRKNWIYFRSSAFLLPDSFFDITNMQCHFWID